MLLVNIAGVECPFIDREEVYAYLENYPKYKDSYFFISETCK